METIRTSSERRVDGCADGGVYGGTVCVIIDMPEE
jgi:hypothetical protein